jgi:hypothetical protein
MTRIKLTVNDGFGMFHINRPGIICHFRLIFAADHQIDVKAMDRK